MNTYHAKLTLSLSKALTSLKRIQSTNFIYVTAFLSISKSAKIFPLGSHTINSLFSFINSLAIFPILLKSLSFNILPPYYLVIFPFTNNQLTSHIWSDVPSTIYIFSASNYAGRYVVNHIRSQAFCFFHFSSIQLSKGKKQT